MYVTLVGLGFSRKYSIPADSTLATLRERIEDATLDTFYRRGAVISNDVVLDEEDTIVGMARSQKIDLG